MNTCLTVFDLGGSCVYIEGVIVLLGLVDDAGTRTHGDAETRGRGDAGTRGRGDAGTGGRVNDE